MKTKHRWYKEIIAWANGETIQWRQPISCPEWEDTSHPSWQTHNNREYRIKPEPKKVKVAVFKSQPKGGEFLALLSSESISSNYYTKVNEFLRSLMEEVDESNSNTNKKKIRFFIGHNKEISVLSIYADDTDNICIDLGEN